MYVFCFFVFFFSLIYLQFNYNITLNKKKNGIEINTPLKKQKNKQTAVSCQFDGYYF